MHIILGFLQNEGTSPGMLIAWQITLLKYYLIAVPTRQHSTPKLPKAVEKGYLHPICTYRAPIALVKA